jgi:hypothetical protein
MRVGFIRQLLWERYGTFWASLLQDLGVETQQATSDGVTKAFSDQRVQNIPGISFQLAAAEALALANVDLLVVPDLNEGFDINRGGGQDPWIANFPATLAQLGGLPPLLKVPATLRPDLEPLVTQTLMSLKRDPSKVRLLWERYRSRTQAKRYSEQPRWTKLPEQQEVVGVVGQPWLVAKVLPLLDSSKTHFAPQSQLNPATLRGEAKRLEKRLIATDAEVLGAAHFFNRKGDINKLMLIVDKTSGADLWLEQQAKKIVTKPLEVVYLQDLVPDTQLVETLLVRDS